MKVTVVSPLTLPSNAINLATGSNRSEPRQVTTWANKQPSTWMRFCIGINTYFPEVQGAYYENRALSQLVLQAFTENSCAVIVNDILSSSELCPNEADGYVAVGDECSIVRDAMCIGAVYVWEMSAGGGSEFYQDAIVWSCLGNAALAVGVFDSISRRCFELKIAVRQYSLP